MLVPLTGTFFLTLHPDNMCSPFSSQLNCNSSKKLPLNCPSKAGPPVTDPALLRPLHTSPALQSHRRFPQGSPDPCTSPAAGCPLLQVLQAGCFTLEPFDHLFFPNLDGSFFITTFLAYCSLPKYHTAVLVSAPLSLRSYL